MMSGSAHHRVTQPHRNDTAVVPFGDMWAPCLKGFPDLIPKFEDQNLHVQLVGLLKQIKALPR